MTRLDLSLDGDTRAALGAQVRELSAALAGERVNLTELGNLYGRITQSLLAAINKNGISSLRFRAAAKALDLKSPKSQLVTFLRDSSAEDEPTCGER